jgi:hypothetical protein
MKLENINKISDLKSGDLVWISTRFKFSYHKGDYHTRNIYIWDYKGIAIFEDLKFDFYLKAPIVANAFWVRGGKEIRQIISGKTIVVINNDFSIENFLKVAKRVIISKSG